MPAERTIPLLTVYGRTWFNVWFQLLAGRRAWQPRYRFDVCIVDIDRDAALEARHGERVPVLAHGERELCHYHLDVPAVTDYLTKFG
jgi:thioredoxin reductase (NADPH)